MQIDKEFHKRIGRVRFKTKTNGVEYCETEKKWVEKPHKCKGGDK